MVLIEGVTFDNRDKETPDALDWFRENLYLKDDILYWGESFGTTRRRSKAYLHKPAGCVSARGYIQVRKCRDKFMAHRIIWAMHYGRWPKVGIDHKNGNKTDNRIENMRETTQFQNSKNAQKYPRLEEWVATGVHRSGNRWVASAQVDNVKKYIGCFKCHTAAMIARMKFSNENGFTERHGTYE
jgi:hypothetical protein